MKKILYILSTLSVITPIVIGITVAKSPNKSDINLIKGVIIRGGIPKETERPSDKGKKGTTYSLDGFKNVIKIINQKNDNPLSEKFDYLLESIVPNYYLDTISGKHGRVFVWNSVPQNDIKVVKTYLDDYVNDSPFIRKTPTISHNHEVSETRIFSISLSENIVAGIENKIEGSFSIPTLPQETIGFTFGKETGNKNAWTDSKIITQKQVLPSQEIIQSAHSILHVKHTLSRETTKHNGVIRFRVDNLKEKIFRIPFFHFDTRGHFDYLTWNKYSTKEIIETLKDCGYKKQLMAENKSEYSIFSVDNVERPKNAFVNLPITWSTEDTAMRLEHYEEKI